MSNITVEINGFAVTGTITEVQALLGVVVVQQPKAEAKSAPRSRRSTKSTDVTEVKVPILHLANGETYTNYGPTKSVLVGAKGSKAAKLGDLAKGKTFRIRSGGAVYKVA